jgi:hypothetical protein
MIWSYTSTGIPGEWVMLIGNGGSFVFEGHGMVSLWRDLQHLPVAS